MHSWVRRPGGGWPLRLVPVSLAPGAVGATVWVLCGRVCAVAKECTAHLVQLPVPFRYDYLMAETIFSQVHPPAARTRPFPTAASHPPCPHCRIAPTLACQMRAVALTARREAAAERRNFGTCSSTAGKLAGSRVLFHVPLPPMCLQLLLLPRPPFPLVAYTLNISGLVQGGKTGLLSGRGVPPWSEHASALAGPPSRATTGA